VSLSERLTIVYWLVRDTFRQSLASGIGWVLFALSTVCILVCLSASISAPATLTNPKMHTEFLPRFDSDAHDSHKLKQSGVVVADGTLRLAFGAISVPVARDTRAAVHFLQLVLAAGVADTLGLLLTLVWTAGFLPAFLHPRAVSVLLAKPISRAGLLLGKYVGVLAFVLVQATYFVAGTWLALAIRTGIWDAGYLRAIPLLLLHFAIFFSFSLLLAVCTRSTVTCVFGSIAFWGICWAINFGRNIIVATPDAAAQSSFSSSLVWLADVAYWLFPKPVDLGRLVFESLGAGSHFSVPFDGAASVSLWLSVLTSLLFTGYLLFAASRQFAQADY
jgi:ABC-type transport system involved in multi-copper enzyme maturation permease subunit